MAGENGLLEELATWAASSTIIGTLFYGAIGGAVNAGSAKSRRAFFNQVVVGALCAAGMGGGGDKIVLSLLRIDPTSISGEMSSGTMAFLAGALGPAMLRLAQIKIQNMMKTGEAKDEK